MWIIKRRFNIKFFKKIKAEGVTKKLMGVKIEHDKINVTEAIDITIGSKRVGELRSGVFSPLFKSVIGIAMIDRPYFEVDTKVEIKINNETKTGILCKIPFI